MKVVFECSIAEGRKMKYLLQRAAWITGPDIPLGERDSRNTVVYWATTLIRDSVLPIFIIQESGRPSPLEHMECQFLFFSFLKKGFR